MNIRKLFYLKKINIAKVVMLSCIFLFAFLLTNIKVSAQGAIEILSSTYSGNGSNTEAKEINGIKYIQGTGISNKDGITFKITSMYDSIDDFTAFAVWEAAFSSSSDNADYDRWYIRTYTCEAGDATCEGFNNYVKDNIHVMRDSSNNVIFKADGSTRYYIERESTYYVTGVEGYQETVVDFSKFFTDKEITYTYRIRNATYMNTSDKDGFGYKQIQINYWKSSDGSGDPIYPDPQVIEFGLAKAISDAETYTNNNKDENGNEHTSSNPISCSKEENLDYICIEYTDTNGDPTKSTTVPATTTVHIPDNVLYTHASTTKAQVQSNLTAQGKIDLTYVANHNTTYALNYFCEGNSITVANISYSDGKHSASCGSGAGELRQYLYVEAKLLNSDASSIEITDFEKVNQTTSFVEEPYEVEITLDSRGNYVVIVTDIFGNTNELAVVKVMDIINQAIIANFEKSNKTDEVVVDSDGWKANEYLTNKEVEVSITMSATTVIKEGLPIIEAKTTLLDSSQVKYVYYWRVDGDKYDSDICAEGEKENCALMPSEGEYIKLYESDGTTTSKHSSFVSFVANKLTLKISSNGRYRFYIHTFAGNNTNTSEGSTKNPRVEVYKIDKEAPEILFGGSNNSYCVGESCSYAENTYTYYQGSGVATGNVVVKMASTTQAENVITYTKNGIYYTSADGKSSILASASDADKWFTYLYALFNSKTYVNENLAYYGDKDNTVYSYFQAVTYTGVENVLVDTTLQALLADEEAYREYIISHDIKYTGYSLATDLSVTLKEGQPSYDQNRIKIEYLDGQSSDVTVCNKISSVFKDIDLDGDGKFDQNDCVNYYLDHGIDFKIRITVWDIVQDSEGNYILGNSSTKMISVVVKDTTAPGFSKLINNYNVGGECRIEIGTQLGTNYQTVDKLLECYAIKSDGAYNLEDNVFEDLYTQVQTVNKLANISMYILSKETGKWVNLDDGYIPNRSGQYAILVVIRDDASTTTKIDLAGREFHDVTVASNSEISVSGNAIGVVFSYWVDKKIVLIEPKADEKDYGEDDPVFNYCVYVNKSDSGIATYLTAPFANMNVFSSIGCTTVTDNVASLTAAQLEDLFKGNYDIADFSGILTRQESSLYNDYHYAATANEYVGLYKIVLGSLNITGNAADGYDLGRDYIVKIDPRVRNGGEYQLVTKDGKRRDGSGASSEAKCNLVNSQVYNGSTVSGCYGFEDDDDFFVESTVLLTIKQVVVRVSANGGYKYYGDTDVNYDEFDNDSNGSGYLNGYTVNTSDLKWTDSANVVLGVLRREVGENVGVYSICNYRGTSNDDTVLETTNNMLILGTSNSSAYTTCSTFDSYSTVAVNTGVYKNGILVGDLDDADKIEEYENYIKSRALYIAPNVVVAYYKTLNALDTNSTDIRDNNYANYVISYTQNVFEINPSTLVVQPAPGQRREYSYSGVDEVNPWEVVVYGSKTFIGTEAGEDFNGYTQDSPTYSASENDSQSKDYGSPDSGQENYNNATEDRDVWNLILDSVLYKGFKTNETYSLFEGRISLLGKTPTGGVYENMTAGWYDYNELANSTLEIVVNDRKQCNYSNYISDVDVSYTSDCRNYNLVIDLDYRNEDGYKNGDTDADGDEVTVVYKSKLGYCKTTSLGNVSDVDVQCSDAQATKILFEVYRREIILEFNSLLEQIPSNSADIVYGYRYDYYETNLFTIDEDTLNVYLENSLFYCYASFKEGLVGLSGNCTGNKWYGLTEGDSWDNIDLTFKLHSIVSASNSDYYTTGDDKAIPAGRYYVYASIGSEAQVNYKFNYLGGTLTIKTKVVDVIINEYSKEYGNVYYDNVTCMKDGSLLNSNDSLISDCTDKSNTATNTYGFVINGLDNKDTIAENFTGRPKRVTNLTNTSTGDFNGLQENVGIYQIGVGSIHSKNNNSFNSCSDNFLASSGDCVVVTGVNINNYIIANDSTYTLTYYLLKNATRDDDTIADLNYGSDAHNSIVNVDDRDVLNSKLTINPAHIEITVTPNQTKMYGCSYNSVNTTSLYKYSYTDSLGYDCVEDTGTNYDLGYEYTVKGDKDYYIYMNGYYDTNYNFEDTYTSSKINMVNESALDNSLLTGNVSGGIGRSSALNGGVLYRVNVNDYDTSISYASLIEAANKAQDLESKTYQGQSVGTYIITLGNLDATLTSRLTNYNATNNDVCGTDNIPGSGTEICKNYIINYYDNTSVDSTHEYDVNEEDTKFTITTRVAFVYTEYNSKVYGNLDPTVSATCTQEMINNGFCDTLDETINYGISAYYTKYNSLAKAPWVASIETGSNIYFTSNDSNDVQTDVITGLLSRYGENNGVKSTDDIVGDYNYLFTGLDYTDYSRNNYKFNFYYRELDDDGNIVISDGNVDDSINAYIEDSFAGYTQKQAVNKDGGNTQIVDEETKEVLFEITLRKITVTLIDFSKVYGIEDSSLYYDLGICATGDQTLGYDSKGNPICSEDESEHGLSPNHKNLYMNNGVLKQSEFKEAFKVTFLRVLGENVACSGSAVTGTISGYFTDRTTEYQYNLACNGDKYEALGIINQEFGELGYNYEITYVEGNMSILTRSIDVTPDANQGFQYGSYTYPSLIPAITFGIDLSNVSYAKTSQKVVAYEIDGSDAKVIIVNRDGTTVDANATTTSSGLVNGGETVRVCLDNIDGVNTFCINDRQDTYDTTGKATSTSSFTENSNGTVTDGAPTYVFGDVYASEESNRSALNRSLGSASDERYNRNVGTYTIIQGDLTDKSGNYRIVFTSGVEYKITPANVKITPDDNQNKVYGESDKELTFTVVTTYTVNSLQYVVADSNIVSIKDSEGNEINLTPDATGRILVSAGSTVTLNGFAYYENSNVEGYNYGVAKNSNKSDDSDPISQTNVTGKSYDKYCYDNYTDNSTLATGAISGCNNQNISFESTTLVLTGYLYVTGYNQTAGNHLIANGFVVSKNEFNNQNYSLEFVDSVNFEIKKLNINVEIKAITKVYGQATDAYKCETGVDCSSNYATLSALDNEGMLEYNFDIYYEGNENRITLTNDMVLMVNAIGGNYYTQSEGKEDKNNYLGINVIRKVNNATTCTIASDVFGCEDVGAYTLSFRKFSVTDRIDENYNLMFSDTNVTFEEITNDYIIVDTSSHEVVRMETINVINEVSANLTINKREVDIFVNTNLNTSSANYYEIEQNIVVPNLPTINNSYNLINYVYDASKVYHGLGDDASSKSDNSDLDSTYTTIVWGDHPNQVRISDALVGELAYCNEPSNGNNYPNIYPSVNTTCSDSNNLVYNDNKSRVNTNTKDKFIVMTRDVNSELGLKIMSSEDSTGVANNDYENKNYDVSFYAGAIHVIGDSADPTLIINNKDYYIEANAVNDGGSISGSASSIGTILEYLFNDTDKNYILASVDDNGNMYITINNTKIEITQASLLATYGNVNESYPGIVSGSEQALIYPFISDYANVTSGGTTYLDEVNINSLKELVTTLVKWFGVTSYDSGQVINGQYLERKFDKYYYVAINKNGYDIAGNINNTFEINKVGTYTLSFYVMDNAGRVSKDGNIAKLHIIDTTAPSAGELTLYGSAVKCDSDCNVKDKWYIADNRVRLSVFNRYSRSGNEIDGYVYYLDSAGEYIYFAELGDDVGDEVYASIASLKDNGIITTENYVDYVNTSGAKYSAYGIIHYSWSSNPDGVYLTITGSSDNSYTVNGNSEASQWQQYYSIDGGVYWLDYILSENMSSYAALTSDGYRTIKSTVIDSAINKIETNYTYTISYDACFEGCSEVEILNKVVIDGTTYSFGENDVKNTSFIFDANTTCEVNKLGTLVTCTTTSEGQPDQIKRVKLEGDKFTLDNNIYQIAGNNLLTSSGEYKSNSMLTPKHVVIDGIKYRFDESAMMLYRDYIGALGEVTESGQTLTIEENEYVILGTEILRGGVNVATIENYKFNLAGIDYMYIDDASGTDYYLGTVSYTVYQDTFKIGGNTYNMSSFNNNIYEINKDVLRLTKSINYTDTYRLYDKYLLGINDSYVDSNEASEESLYFRINVTSNSKWLQASDYTESYATEELLTYLNMDATNFKDTKNSKTAYLDTVAPLLGTTISTTVGNATTNVKYGEDWYVYEFGYNNTMVLSESLSYYLRGITYTIDKTNNEVVDSDGKKYPITVSGLADVTKKYVYQVNYTNYYIDEDYSSIRWLNSYVEKYVGAKDMPSTSDINVSESKYYNLNISTYLGNIADDTPKENILISNNTASTESSGLGSDKYITSGKSSTLYDFVYLGQYEQGIYYEDIEYIVWYLDALNNVVKVSMKDKFEECYLNDGKITQDCAQKAIAEVIAPDGPERDITYTINYVVRDKAGNASSYASRGVLFATILPATNVVVNNIVESENNSEIEVAQISDNTYSLRANQGVSLDLLASAFSVNYSTSQKSYNKAAVMTIYKEDELIAENVSGVAFTDYIDSSEIADYTIIYSMNSQYVTAYGERIDIAGETITLHLSIQNPVLEQNNNINIGNMMKNGSSIVLYAIIIGVLGLIASLGIVLIVKKKKN